MEEARILRSRCDKQTDKRHYSEDRRETRRRRLSRDVPIPRKTFDPEPIFSEEMIWIKSLGNLMRVPVPNCRRQQRNSGKKSQIASFHKLPTQLSQRRDQKRRGNNDARDLN